MAEQAAMRHRRRRRTRFAKGVAMVLTASIAMLGVLSFLGRKRPEDVRAGGATTTTVAAIDAPCPKPDGSSPRRNAFRRPPRFCIRPDGKYLAKFETDTGTFTINLDTEHAPETVNNFVFLARYHFFDGVPFHRVRGRSYVQGGNPPETGVTGPGYTFADENIPKPPARYQIGEILMAHERTNSNGSQFVIITGADGENLPLAFPLFGAVEDGLDVVLRVAADGGDDFTPKVLHTIREVSIVDRSEEPS